MKIRRGKKPSKTENVEQAETADLAERETATDRIPENRDEPPRRDRIGKFMHWSRANPRAKPVRVVRAWPGVTNGQEVVLHKDRQKRLLRAGFVEEI